MSFALMDDQKVSLAVTGADDAGNPVPLTGTPVYAVDQPALLTLTDNGDGTAVVASTGTLGTATVTVTDAETDGQAFVGSLAVDVVNSALTVIQVTAGTPEHV